MEAEVRRLHQMNQSLEAKTSEFEAKELQLQMRVTQQDLQDSHLKDQELKLHSERELVREQEALSRSRLNEAEHKLRMVHTAEKIVSEKSATLRHVQDTLLDRETELNLSVSPRKILGSSMTRTPGSQNASRVESLSLNDDEAEAVLKESSERVNAWYQRFREKMPQ